MGKINVDGLGELDNVFHRGAHLKRRMEFWDVLRTMVV